ncbi:hypothetical protein JZ751_006527 [Albula glossodonta]|uniref:Uncharacterized protein n=1 Tax=Albula glossodonta TaxID=121402 RepID=A0A8T2NAH2_9TELE|nr:hypothetical protein JZ751_006527 [Albula glossodonta]
MWCADESPLSRDARCFAGVWRRHRAHGLCERANAVLTEDVGLGGRWCHGNVANANVLRNPHYRSHSHRSMPQIGSVGGWGAPSDERQPFLLRPPPHARADVDLISGDEWHGGPSGGTRDDLELGT